MSANSGWGSTSAVTHNIINTVYKSSIYIRISQNVCYTLRFEVCISTSVFHSTSTFDYVMKINKVQPRRFGKVNQDYITSRSSLSRTPLNFSVVALTCRREVSDIRLNERLFKKNQVKCLNRIGDSRWNTRDWKSSFKFTVYIRVNKPLACLQVQPKHLQNKPLLW